MKQMLLFALCLASFGAFAAGDASEGLQVGVFDIDVTPPVGSRLMYDDAIGTWDLGLRGRGIVLLGAGDPIVICSIDWIGIGNGAHDAFRDGLAEAVGTTRERVAVHTVHQHDAPTADFSTEDVMKTYGIPFGPYEGAFAREILLRLKEAAAAAALNAQPLTHVGLGSAEVSQVASNRRIMGTDGKVRATRYTSCANAELRAEPEGVIDPVVSVVSLWNGDVPVAALSYYATHPQSYYRTGIPNPDFPGVARFLRQMEVPAALHVHFTGAGANIGAGKYNDGSKENRLLLAQRLCDGLRQAWDTSVKTPVTAADIGWAVEPVALPPAPHLDLEQLESDLRDKKDPDQLQRKARAVAWVKRCRQGHKIDIACLRLATARILHMPGELFVEYQLAAKAERPDLFVAMTAYGDYAPGYIGTTRAYDEGGYETSETASRVAPNVEDVLMRAVRNLLAQ